jgi:hypothetical protein
MVLEASTFMFLSSGGVLQFSKYSGIFRSVHTIYVEEGVRGMYRGYSAAMLSFPVYFLLYFPTYEFVKGQLHQNSTIGDVRESIHLNELK